MRKTLFLSSLAALLICSQASAQTNALLPVDPQVRYGKLDNGLTYYIRHNEEPKDRVYFYIAQKVGSVNENDDQRGLAHFLEHMCFNGSENFPGDGALIKYCESIGVRFGYNLNAYTSTDETVYNIDGVPVSESNIDSCLLIIHDWADGLLLSAEEIDKERGVIHEEWRMRSSPTMRMLDRCLPDLYPGSKYGQRMPIGLMSIVDNFEPEVLRAYYRTWYRPDLQGVVIVGDIDVDRMEEKIKKVLGPMKMPENPVPFEYFPVPSNEEPIYVIEKDKEQNNPLALIMMKTESLPRESRNTIAYFANNYVASIVTSALNARLDELSHTSDCPFVYAKSSYGTYMISKTMDALEIVVVSKEGRDKEAAQAVMKEVERARRFGFTAGEIFRMKEDFRSSEEKLYDNRDKQNSSYFVKKYVRSFLDATAIPGIETEKQIYDMLAGQIPVEAFNAAFADLTKSITKDFVFLEFYPEKEGLAVPSKDEIRSAVEAAHAADLEPYVDNVKDEPLVAVLPKAGKIKKADETSFGYTRLSLANGANVYYKKTDFNNSEVLFGARSKGGLSLIEDKDLVNATLLPSVLDASGVGEFNSLELQKALAGKQVSLTYSLNIGTEGLSGNATPKDLRTLFELVYLAFTKPADDPQAYENVYNSVQSYLLNAEKDPFTAFSDTITTTLYGNNPRKQDLHLKDLEKADYSVIKRLYSERFASAGDFDFFFTGNFDEDSLKTFVSQYIAPLPKMKKRETYVHRNILPVPGTRAKKFSRDMETPQACLIQVIWGSTPYSLKESISAKALGKVLSDRYLKTIREDRGMAYNVSTSCMEDFNVDETFSVETEVPFTPSMCDSVIVLIKEGIDEISANGITDDELSQIKKYRTKVYADSQRQNSYWQNLIMNLVVWGKDERTNYLEYLENLSSDDVKAFLNDVVLKSGNMVTVAMLPVNFEEKQ